MGKIFYIMGKSSSGKDTMYRELLEYFAKYRQSNQVQQTLPFKPVALYTTRPIRKGEMDGVEYHFISEAQADSLEKDGKIIEIREYQTIYGVWKYMTVDDGRINLQKYNYLMIGTLESYEKIKRYFGRRKVEPLYIEVEDGERLLRAIKREQAQAAPAYEEMCRRFLADALDFSEENLKKSEIEKRFQNNNQTKCFNELRAYIIQNSCE